MFIRIEIRGHYLEIGRVPEHMQHEDMESMVMVPPPMQVWAPSRDIGFRIPEPADDM